MIIVCDVIKCLVSKMSLEITADELEEIVMTWVSQQKADVLEEVYKVIPLTCADEIKGKRLKLLNALLAHLVGLDDTQVEAANRKIHAFMQSAGSDVKPALPPIEEDGITGLLNKASSNDVKSQDKETPSSNSVVDLVRFKEFKISGTILGKGETRISYASLKHLVENAQKMRYSETMITLAIIKAISPSHKVKSLLESKRGLTVEEIMEMLRAHYKKEDRSSVLTELRTAVQQPADSALDFVTELMCLKSRVIELSREESYPIDLEMLTKDLFKSMFTGMRNPNIRSELREVCGKHTNQNEIDDKLLTRYVSEAMANEEERQKKLMGAKIAANSVESEPVKPPDNPKPQRQRDNPFDKIEELRLSQEKEMSMLRADFAEVKTALLTRNQEPIPKPPNHFNNGGGGSGQVSWQGGGNPGGRQQGGNDLTMQQGSQSMHSSNVNGYASAPGHGFVPQAGIGNPAAPLAGPAFFPQNQPNSYFPAGGYVHIPQGGYAPSIYGPQAWQAYGQFDGSQHGIYGAGRPQNPSNFTGGARGGYTRGRGDLVVAVEIATSVMLVWRGM